MVKNILHQLFGCFIFMLIVVHTAIAAVQLFSVALIKFLIPIKWWRSLTSKILVVIASNWVYVNSFVIYALLPTKWKVEGNENLTKNDWYMLISNHQSWVDIVVLQKVMAGKIPFIKFFLKKELIKVPVMGLAWWALDFPFMQRYTREQIEKNPELKGKDIEITRKACEKFKTDFITVMTFPEGTRFTKKKHDKQKSPYRHLLKPKAGGLSFTISAMGEKFSKLLNVTIVYPYGVKTYWEYLCGRVKEIDVRIESVTIPGNFCKADLEDPKFQEEFKNWLNGLWQGKDKLLESELGGK